MNIRLSILPLFLLMLTLCVSAPEAVSANRAEAVDTLYTHATSPKLLGKINQLDLFHHLDLGVNVGTTGLGLELSTPVGPDFRVRTGLDFTPHVNVPVRFELVSYLPGQLHATPGDYGRFDQLSALMESLTGLTVDRYVDTNAHGTMVNFKLLVDWFPLKNNKHWYATAGFYWGSSRVGHADNTIGEAPALVGVLIYNRLYDFFAGEKYLDEPLVAMGTGDGYFVDPDVGDVLRDKFSSYGRVGAKSGYFTDGPFKDQPYMMTPNKDGIVYADLYVNHFKPYLGLGFTTNLSKDQRWHLSVDAGTMFWGRPKVLTHERYILDASGQKVGYGMMDEEDMAQMGYTFGDRIDIANEVDRTIGKLGDYLDVARAMKVYPVLNLKISYKLF